MSLPYRLAILSTHPIQYHTPWFRGLAAHPDLRIHVYYCQRPRLRNRLARDLGLRLTGTCRCWRDIRTPSCRMLRIQQAMEGLQGSILLRSGSIIRERQYDAVLVNGWNYKSAWQAIWAAWRSGVKVFVRGDSHLHAPRSLPVKIDQVDGISTLHSALRCLSRSRPNGRANTLHTMERVQTVFFLCRTRSILSTWLPRVGELQPMRSELRRHWGLREDGVVFLFVGKFTLNEAAAWISFVPFVSLGAGSRCAGPDGG